VTKIRIFHNVSADAIFGLNRVFDPAAEGHVRRAATGERHPLVPVFEYEAPGDPATDTERLLHSAFELFNVGHDPDFGVPDPTALAYRARKLRSVSKGDVVQVGDNAYACESRGWAAVGGESMFVVDGKRAEHLIRERYQLKPHEPLCLTVPQPQQEAELDLE